MTATPIRPHSEQANRQARLRSSLTSEPVATATEARAKDVSAAVQSYVAGSAADAISVIPLDQWERCATHRSLTDQRTQHQP